MDFWRDVFVPVVAAAIGTAAGATVAFFIERYNKKRDAENANVTATHVALFALCQILNDAATLKRNQLDPFRDDPDRWYMLRPFKIPPPPSFDVENLSYLFDLPGEAPNLPMEIHVCIGMYLAIVNACDERYKVHMLEAQPALEKANQTLASKLSIEQRINAILGGERVTVTLQKITDDLYMLIDLTLEMLPKHINRLRDVAEKEFPNRQISRVVVDAGADAGSLR